MDAKPGSKDDVSIATILADTQVRSAIAYLDSETEFREYLPAVRTPYYLRPTLIAEKCNPSHTPGFGSFVFLLCCVALIIGIVVWMAER